MIHYELVCDGAHKFDGWFRNAEAYDEQRRRGIVTCPICSSKAIDKALMAPALAKPQAQEKQARANVSLAAGHPQHAELREALKALRHKVTSEADYVGDKFAEEARRIHFKDVDPRGIYGEATAEEVASLLEDGVDFMPLPNLPEEHN